MTELPVQFNPLLRLIMYNFTQFSVVPSWKQQRVFSLSSTHHFRRCVLINPMASGHNEDIDVTTSRKRKRLCGICGQEGHDRRTCRSVVQEDRNSDVNLERRSTPPPRDDEGTDFEAQQTPQNDAVVLPQLGHCLYCVLDLETTGFSRSRNHIIEVAAQILKHDGVPLENGSFESLVRPPTKIPSFIGTLTGITDEMVKNCEDFTSVMTDFFKFINDKVDEVEEAEGRGIDRVVFVCHNGMKFDLPFLMSELKRNDLFALLNHRRYGYTIDTYVLAKIVVRFSELTAPPSYKLADLYRYVTGSDMDQTHRALADVRACGAVFRYGPFWDARENHLSYFIPPPDQPEEHATLDDSDTDSEDSDESTTDSDDYRGMASVGWHLNRDFEGNDSATDFKDHFRKKSRNSVGIRTGLQCSDSSVNSPMKAWRQIFTHAILERIVLYTNQYGSDQCKDWTGVCRQDITDFLAILFIGKLFHTHDYHGNPY